MSRQTNNKPDPLLKALLDKKSPEPLDGFDKEALQGFALLENDQEALDLKAALDGEMNARVFNRPKKPLTLYWVAAAGLLVTIGLSVYFLMSGSGAPVVQKELAIHKPQPSENGMDQSFERKAAQLDAPEKENAGRGKISEAKPRLQANPVAASEGRAMNASPAAAPQEVAAASPVQERAAKDLNSSSLAADDADKDIAGSFKADSAAMPSPHKSMAFSAQSASKKSRQAPGEAEEKPGSFESAKSASGPEPITCYYKGGDALLQKELTERLISKDLDRHFEVMVTINSTGRIQKVLFLKEKGLSFYEKSEISNVIESLDKFRFSRSPVSTDVADYKITR